MAKLHNMREFQIGEKTQFLLLEKKHNFFILRKALKSPTMDRIKKEIKSKKNLPEKVSGQWLRYVDVTVCSELEGVFNMGKTYYTKDKKMQKLSKEEALYLLNEFRNEYKEKLHESGEILKQKAHYERIREEDLARFNILKTEAQELWEFWNNEASSRMLRPGEWERISALQDSFDKLGLEWKVIEQGKVTRRLKGSFDYPEYLDQDEWETETVSKSLSSLGIESEDLSFNDSSAYLATEDYTVKVDYFDDGLEIEVVGFIDKGSMAIGRSGLTIQ